MGLILSSPVLRRPPPPQPQGLPKQTKCDMCGAALQGWKCLYCGTRASDDKKTDDQKEIILKLHKEKIISNRDLKLYYNLEHL